MAAVFLMQPLGQIAASATSLLILVTIGKTQSLVTKKDFAVVSTIVDNMRRLVILAGTALIFVTFLLLFAAPVDVYSLLEIKSYMQ